MHRVEIFVITKDGGTNLSKYDILGNYNEEKDQLVSGFLAALNSFAKDVGFPGGVSLIRSGSLEARYSVGEFVFTVLIIDYSIPLGMMTEPILSGMAKEITQEFEAKFRGELVEARDSHIINGAVFAGFDQQIQRIIEEYANETMELYQKLVLIEAMYAKVPQKWCLPLMERASEGHNILDDLYNIPFSYRSQLKEAVDKVNFSAAPVWEIFGVPILRFL